MGSRFRGNDEQKRLVPSPLILHHLDRAIAPVDAYALAAGDPLHRIAHAHHRRDAQFARGDRAVTISSSGNAAIATSRYAALHGVPAVVFVHPETDPAKLASIDGTTTTLVVGERAINGAKLLARELRIPNLRPSTSDEALVGYASLGEELAGELPDEVDAVVLFATSGATALAVAEAMARLEAGQVRGKLAISVRP